MAILEELYYGNICPSDRMIKKGSEYQKLGKALSEDTDQLYDLLNAEGKELYERIAETKYRQDDISERELFIEGFRLGARIMLEILTEPEKQLVSL